MTTQSEGATKVTIKLIKFGGESCGACVAMNKARTLERLTEDFPHVEVVSLDVNDKDGETPKGTKFDENYVLSDEYEVQVLPTMIFEDAESGDELHRVEGAVSFKELRGALAEAEEEREDQHATRARAKKVKK